MVVLRGRGGGMPEDEPGVAKKDETDVLSRLQRHKTTQNRHRTPRM